MDSVGYTKVSMEKQQQMQYKTASVRVLNTKLNYL